ncbi:MAG: Sec-independent protein translocase protein TatB [Alphaproteobacteria bacterium]|nr:Sec-independent protein translocase protein TatB [Alphaproteobacteria bacterium]
MLDIGFQELLIIAAVAIIVVGPKQLPHAMKAVMAMVRKAKAAAREFQSGIDELVREAELDDVRKELEKADVKSIAQDFEKSVDPTGEFSADVKEAMNLSEVKSGIEDTADTFNRLTNGSGEKPDETPAPSTETASPPPAETPKTGNGAPKRAAAKKPAAKKPAAKSPAASKSRGKAKRGAAAPKAAE